MLKTKTKRFGDGGVHIVIPRSLGYGEDQTVFVLDPKETKDALPKSTMTMEEIEELIDKKIYEAKRCK
jgi:hypothetical protein